MRKGKKMKTFLKLYSSKSKTGIKLLNALEEEGLLNYTEVTPQSRDYRLIRWGCTKGVKFRPAKVVNSQKSVRLATNKFETLRLLNNISIPVPNFSGCREDMNGVFLARNDSHRGGTDIVFNGFGDFYTEYIPNDKEFRVHVFNGKIIGVQEKVFSDLEDGVEESEFPIRNHKRGYVFELRSIAQADSELKILAQKSVLALSLNFVAVDIIQDIRGKYWVLEVNTAPSLEQTMFNRYAKEIVSIMKTEDDCPDYWEWVSD